MITPRHTLFPALALAAALLLGACGDDDDAATTDTSEEATETEGTTSAESTGGDTVTMEQSRFAPDPLEVTAGTEVTFENQDPFAHTVTSAEGSSVEFDSGELAEGETFTQTFDDAGSYEYFCEIHPTMRAEVVVG